jgi:hypothetical protein
MNSKLCIDMAMFSGSENCWRMPPALNVALALAWQKDVNETNVLGRVVEGSGALG